MARVKHRSMPSVMKHRFSEVPTAEIPRSAFDRSHGFKTTMDVGYLVPMFVDEALPGDTFSCSMAGFCRLATPLHPIMDNLMISTFFFCIPMRLVWDNWQKFNGEQVNPGDSTDYLIPVMTAPVGGYPNGSLSDYLGLPTKVAGYEHSSLVHRAYNLVYNEWFRDQNLQNSVVVDKDDGPDDPADYVLLRRGKRHDYFTSALPWPQKGPAVEFPIGGLAPISGLGVGTTQGFPDLNTPVKDTADGVTQYAFSENIAAGGIRLRGTGTASTEDLDVYADLNQVIASGNTINALRQAFQIQKMYERDARGGSRYIEIVKAHFGVNSPDARLQRPEYLGGGTSPIVITPIAQVSESGTTPQGNLAAVGTGVVDGHSFTKSFTEHCIILGLCSVRADLNYQQGLPRMYSRQTRHDFYWPALAHIGEQAILNKEIYTQGTGDDELVFGYQERYAEYRYKPSVITGQFRSNDATPLDTWHLAQDFGALPALNASFIEDNPPVDRVIAVPSEPHLLLDAYFRLRCARPMPIFGVPGLIDHF